MTTTDTTVKLSLRDLPRTLGASVHHDIAWVVPEDLGTSAMWVQPGSTLHLEVDLTSVDEGVLAQVSGEADLHGECVRCLDPVTETVTFEAADVYFEKPRTLAHPSAEEEVPEETRMVGVGDVVDLEPLVRDEVLDLVDPLPLCRPDCPGLCPQCGVHLADVPADHHHDVIDPRLASLAALLGDAGPDGEVAGRVAPDAPIVEEGTTPEPSTREEQGRGRD